MGHQERIRNTDLSNHREHREHRDHGENFIQIWNRLIPSVNCRTLISFFSVVFLFSVISVHPKGRSVLLIVKILYAVHDFTTNLWQGVRGATVGEQTPWRRDCARPLTVAMRLVKFGCGPWAALWFHDLYVFSGPESFDPLRQLPDVEVYQETNRAAGELRYYPGKKVSHPCTY